MALDHFLQNNSTCARVWYSILGRGSEKGSRFVISTGIKDNALEDRSWLVILDSFKRLAEPVEEGRWGGILLFFGADLEYVCNILGLPHYNARENMCTDCLANTTDRPHNVFQANAGWRATLVDNKQYIARVRRPLHPLPAHAAFNRHTYRFDLLHMCDHHGVTSHVIGNVLWAHLANECESNVLPGIRREDRLAFLQQDINAFYRHCNVDNRLPPLKESNIKADAFPELRGNGVKAANTRALLPYVCDLQKRATQQNPTPKNKHMLKVVDLLQTAYDIMYNGGPVLGDNACQALQRTLLRFGENYQLLAVLAHEEGKTRWKTVPKLHYVVGHLADQARLINPKHVQGYASESMVGIVSSIYARSQSGRFRRGIQRVSMLKRRTGLQLLWL